MYTMPDEIKEAIQRSGLDIDKVTITEYIEGLLTSLSQMEDEIVSARCDAELSEHSDVPIHLRLRRADVYDDIREMVKSDHNLPAGS